MQYLLSVLIPARNELFLSKTVQDLLEHTGEKTEIIVGLDGKWADPPIIDNERVTIVYHNTSIGQRAITNELARLSRAKFVAKVDAHCSFDENWDIKMFQAFEQVGDNVTMVSVMRNLHAFDWVCPDGHRRYQGPSGACKQTLPINAKKGEPTTVCGKETKMDIMWVAKNSPQSTSYCFDTEPHFQYFGDFKKRPEGQGDITESMSLQGSCFMMTRKKYWELNICDEGFGSWGSQGLEVAIKTWLSGGKVMVNHKTFYAHMFRTQGGDFGFPYHLGGNQVSSAKKKAKDLFFNNKWDKAIHPLSWLVEKFWPVPHWTQEDLNNLKKQNGEEVVTKGLIYYTDNALNMKLANMCRKQLMKSGLPIVSASLKPMNFGKNIWIKEKRGYLTLAKQILAALEASEADIVFFCEHDVLMHPSHFNFTPPSKDKFYYNQNIWMLRSSDGFAVHYDCNKLSQLCCYRELAIPYYRDLVARIEKEGWSLKEMSFEPGTRDDRWVAWKSEQPNIDIRHDANLTKSKWSKEDFRNEKYFVGWEESTNGIPFWGKINLP